MISSHRGQKLFETNRIVHNVIFQKNVIVSARERAMESGLMRLMFSSSQLSRSQGEWRSAHSVVMYEVALGFRVFRSGQEGRSITTLTLGQGYDWKYPFVASDMKCLRISLLEISI